jgi:hypothetical protein
MFNNKTGVFMNSKEIFKLNFSLTIVYFFIIFFLPFINSQISFAEISVDSYCQLSIQSLQQDIANFQELISLANQYKVDPERFQQLEKVKQIEFKNTKEALFNLNGTTTNEYVTYMGKNQPQVNTYLIDYPDVKKQIDDLSGQVRD